MTEDQEIWHLEGKKELLKRQMFARESWEACRDLILEWWAHQRRIHDLKLAIQRRDAALHERRREAYLEAIAQAQARATRERRQRAKWERSPAGIAVHEVMEALEDRHAALEVHLSRLDRQIRQFGASPELRRQADAYRGTCRAIQRELRSLRNYCAKPWLHPEGAPDPQRPDLLLPPDIPVPQSDVDLRRRKGPRLTLESAGLVHVPSPPVSFPTIPAPLHADAPTPVFASEVDRRGNSLTSWRYGSVPRYHSRRYEGFTKRGGP